MQDAHMLPVLVVIGVAVVALSWLARRLGIAPPIVLLVGGAPLAFVPWLEGVRLPPDVVLLIFLPALLYWESLTTSLREIRANLRGPGATTGRARGDRGRPGRAARCRRPA